MITLDTNNFAAGYTQEQFISGMRTLIAAARKHSDVVIIGLASKEGSKFSDPRTDGRVQQSAHFAAREERVVYRDQERVFGRTYKSPLQRGFVADTTLLNIASSGAQADFLLTFSGSCWKESDDCSCCAIDKATEIRMTKNRLKSFKIV